MKKKILVLGMILVMMITAFGMSGCGLDDLLGESDYVYDAEKVQNSIDTLTASGYKITIRYLSMDTTQDGGHPQIESSGFTIAAAGELWYCQQDGLTTIMDFTDDTAFVIYEKDEGDEKWKKTTANYADVGGKDTLKSLYQSTYISTFTNYGVLAVGLKEKGSATVVGRACTKYESSVSVMGYSYSNEYYIDNETGMCLKNILAVGAAAEGSGSMSYECTEFVTPFTITLPAESDCITETPQS